MMNCKKLVMVGIAALLFAAFGVSSLLAQVQLPDTGPLTDDDIKTFIAVSKATSPQDQAKYLTDNKLDPVKFGTAQAKLLFILGIRAMGQGADAEKQLLASNPTFKYTDAELELINKNEADLVAAYKAYTTVK
ncbi:MAG: hypothetical protein LBS60_13390 [Deltaproteobacteria bacterium]|nr:hypothetical protein [Deltaproteobacteria bacterium]